MLQEATTKLGACPHDCPDTCSMIYTVADGRLTEVRGNPDHPMTRGALCAKVKDFDKHHYNPDRLLYPMRRAGPKGSGHFERITWEEALDEIHRRWSAIVATHGAEAILPYNYLGNEGTVQGLTVGDAFFNRLGATVAEKTFCGSGSCTAWLLTVGPTNGTDPLSFSQSKYIVIWGCNSVSTNLHHWHIVKEAQRNGAKVVVIDPYRSRTAKEADWHLAPRPGTDGALAMAMIQVIIAEGLTDDDYIARHTVGFEALKERAAVFTPEYAADICGIPAEDIRRLAREYATTRNAALRPGIAVERSAGGAQALRAIFSLPALTGSWKDPGGGVYQMPLWEFPIHWDRVCRPDLIPEGTRALNVLKLGEILTGEAGISPGIHALMVYNANPVSNATETAKIKRGLAREDLFTVVSEHFVTDTARYADILLPATMAAEHDDMMFSWGHFFFTLNQKAIEPPGETVSNAELFRRLARRFGFTEPQFAMSEAELMEWYLDWDSPKLGGITMDHFREHGWYRLNLGEPGTRTPHAEGNFPTPSGKCEFWSETAATTGNFVAPPFRQMYEAKQGGEALDPLPGYVPANERPETNPAQAERYPLNIVSPKSHGFLNSQYANEAHKIRAQGGQAILINPQDAGPREITEGALVRVFNDRGAFHGEAKVTEDVPPGLVVASLGYWHALNRDGAVNVISASTYGGMGHSPTYSDNLVQVGLAQ
ncbi:molybdopterin-containing oxidoreductase family protein [Methylobacterium oxalidis]|uniref:Molybdopterin oxidoreductase n=1 Tax=Methylobacterium oxalidis TaxID=944322 RepID=A0A512J4Q9_9HYPH|nr:molybdopterin-dependent oxidoreductase [Methylobacterium oxalidis]GEP04941.1 molybdopterin oxidoreductase [Methylobacterium oxalidis]GJE35165.1 Dimethyl sulfoxide reductase DmsA [Methylobacterium oxalidis]GLS63678.1 molybdopterin oxidoreductase [Methylobacterium oxalidis]